MPVKSPEVIRYAAWNIINRFLANRIYSIDQMTINPKTTGSFLPAHRISQEIQQSPDLTACLSSARLFTDLPQQFYTILLSILETSNQPVFPRMRENKNISAAKCIKKMSPENQKRLSIENWESLG